MYKSVGVFVITVLNHYQPNSTNNR